MYIPFTAWAISSHVHSLHRMGKSAGVKWATDPSDGLHMTFAPWFELYGVDLGGYNSSALTEIQTRSSINARQRHRFGIPCRTKYQYMHTYIHRSVLEYVCLVPMTYSDQKPPEH
jgi:hypothetical protein